MNDHHDVSSVPATSPRSRLGHRRARAAALALACATVAVTALTRFPGADGASSSSSIPVADSPSTSATSEAQPPPLRSRPKAVIALPPGQAPPAEVSVNGGRSSAPASDAEVRSELAAFRAHLNGAGAPTGPVPKILPNGTAVAPDNAPARVVAVIAAANEIATKPYKWGGGHGAWRDSGYDCSGSVSFALAGAGLLDAPLTSGGFMSWGEPGRGKWITIYANDGHMFMVVAGLRFDTSGANGGTRWQTASRSTTGLQPRHLPGL